MSTTDRSIVVLINPSSEDKDFIIKWTLRNIHRPNRDHIHLVTGHSLVTSAPPTPAENEEYRKQLEALREAYLNEAEGLSLDVGVIEEHGESMGDLLSDYVKKLQADVLLISSADLNTLKREKRWSGSFSAFCVHHIHCHVIVVKHPHDGGVEDKDFKA